MRHNAKMRSRGADESGGGDCDGGGAAGGVRVFDAAGCTTRRTGRWRVPVFENKSFRQGWGDRLTEAIKKNIEARTPLRSYRDTGTRCCRGRSWMIRKRC